MYRHRIIWSHDYKDQNLFAYSQPRCVNDHLSLWSFYFQKWDEHNF